MYVKTKIIKNEISYEDNVLSKFLCLNKKEIPVKLDKLKNLYLQKYYFNKLMLFNPDFNILKTLKSNDILVYRSSFDYFYNIKNEKKFVFRVKHSLFCSKRKRLNFFLLLNLEDGASRLPFQAKNDLHNLSNSFYSFDLNPEVLTLFNYKKFINLQNVSFDKIMYNKMLLLLTKISKNSHLKHLNSDMISYLLSTCGHTVINKGSSFYNLSLKSSYIRKNLITKHKFDFD